MSSRTQQIEQLVESFQAIRRKMGSKRALTSHAALCSITHAQWGVLRTVSQKGITTIKDIAAQLEISSSAATQLVDGLVENGYLKRKDNPEDRRSLFIEYTEKTKKQMRSMQKAHVARLSKMFAALDDKELSQFIRLSAKIVHHVITRPL